MASTFHEEIDSFLEEHRDASYQAFQSRLIPSIDPASMVGVRTPALRAFAKRLAKREDADAFLADLPHRRFEENQLHAFMLDGMRDYDRLLAELQRFLPYVDNWATCDQMPCRALMRDPERTLACALAWTASRETYVVRFGIGVLLRFYLDDLFDPAQMDAVARLRSDAYYVNMMRAWYMAEAAAKRPRDALRVLEGGALDAWTRDKAVQKAVESRRVTPELKDRLRDLRRASRSARGVSDGS